jgi:hypothetical protein
MNDPALLLAHCQLKAPDAAPYVALFAVRAPRERSSTGGPVTAFLEHDVMDC